MHANEKIFSFLNKRMTELVFDKKFLWQTEYFFANYHLIEFRISPFLRGNGEKNDFYDIRYFLGFCPHNVSRKGQKWYLLTCNIQLLSSERCFFLYISVRQSVRPSRIK